MKIRIPVPDLRTVGAQQVRIYLDVVFGKVGYTKVYLYPFPGLGPLTYNIY